MMKHSPRRGAATWPTRLRAMSYIGAAFIGAGLALLIVGAIVVLVWATRRRKALLGQQDPTIDPLVERLIHQLPIGATVVGPHDEILGHNEAALRTSLVQGTRLGYKRLLDHVRDVRHSGTEFSGDITREAIPGEPALSLTVSISQLDEHQLLVLGFDNAQSRRVEAIRRDFVANVSHELKTPIGAIGVLAEAVEAAKDDPDAVERFSGRLQRETKRLSELVSQIINLSRLQSVDPNIAHEPVALVDVVEDAIGNCRESARNRRVQIIIGELQDVTIAGDKWELTDAVTNLVQNAINYSDSGARVAVSIVEKHDKGEDIVEVKVSDNGIGISKEDQERIFERFYRVDYGRSRSTGGTGLGLSIVRHIVKAHGGTITVWSNLGQGSTFTLRFPVPKDLQGEGKDHDANSDH